MRKGSLRVEPTTESGRMDREGTWARGYVGELLSQPLLLSVISKRAAMLVNASLEQFSRCESGLCAKAAEAS